jgi:hypothetical protein
MQIHFNKRGYRSSGCRDEEKPWGPIFLDLALAIKHAPPPGSRPVIPSTMDETPQPFWEDQGIAT